MQFDAHCIVIGGKADFMETHKSRLLDLLVGR